MKVDHIDHMGTDLRIVNAARVSFNKWKDEFDDADAGLLRYLAVHRHDSPFFHPQITLRIEAPIYVARQLFRHEVGASETDDGSHGSAYGMVYGPKNEVSRRYVDDTPEIEFPKLWRGRPLRGQTKQGSSVVLPIDQQSLINMRIKKFVDFIIQEYDWLLAQGVAPEQARTVLPMATITKWIWTGSIAFFARVCRDRLAPDAQAETREVAVAIDTIMREIYEVSWPMLLGETN